MAGPGNSPELHGSFSFVVNPGDKSEMLFSECTLPSLEVETLEQKEGGYTTGVHLLPGPVKSGRLTLKRGLTKPNELLKWYRDVVEGNVQSARRTVTLTMLDSKQQPVLRLTFSQAYPVKWVGPTFKASDSTVAIETLELAFAEFRFE